MEWFAYKIKVDDSTNVDLENGHYPDWNFNTFNQAFLLVFVVLTVDLWSEKYFKYYRAVGGALSSIFFLTLIIVG